MEPYKKAELLKALFQAVGAMAAGWNGIVYRAVGTEYANKRDLLPAKEPNASGADGPRPAALPRLTLAST